MLVDCLLVQTGVDKFMQWACNLCEPIYKSSVVATEAKEGLQFFNTGGLLPIFWAYLVGVG